MRDRSDRPATLDEPARIGDVLDAAGEALCYIRLHGGGPESQAQTGQGVGGLLAALGAGTTRRMGKAALSLLLLALQTASGAQAAVGTFVLSSAVAGIMFLVLDRQFLSGLMEAAANHPADVAFQPKKGKWRDKVFPNTRSGFQQLRTWLAGFGVSSAHVCMEATNVYWEDLAEDFPVAVAASAEAAAAASGKHFFFICFNFSSFGI